MDRRVQAYLRKGSRHVPGWLHGHSARFIADLSDIQKRKGLSGSVGEIGVHMGRLFILLHLTRAPGETSFAVDVFGDQHLNVDRSGAGDREKFLANVARWGGSTDGIELIQKSSLAVRPEEILNRAGRCRLLSIDGGHTEECVLNDMRLAEAVLQDHGIVILDDYFHPSWPDVSTGTARYALDPSTRLRPLAITSGKLFRPARMARVLPGRDPSAPAASVREGQPHVRMRGGHLRHPAPDVLAVADPEEG